MDTYLSKSWQTVHGMIDAFFVLLPKIILAIVVFALFWLLGIVVNRLVGYISRKYRRARNLSIVLGRVSHAVVIVLGLLVSLTIVAPTFHTTDLIKVLGIGTVAIGFAFRDILQNFLAGILLLLHEPFRIEDEIKMDDFEGSVEAIETRATIMRTFDDDLAESDVKIRVLYWTRPPRWANLIRVQDLVIRTIRTKLGESGIDLPYPTTQVLFHDQTEDGDGDRRRQREGWPARSQDESQPRNVAHVLHNYLGMRHSTTSPNSAGTTG